MDSIKSKTRAKNFSDEEIMGIVDSLIEENKSRLFGPFSATLTLEDKNQLWDKIKLQCKLIN